MPKSKPRKTAIEKRRRLSELYVKGGEVRFNAEGVIDADPLEEGEEPEEGKNHASDDDVVVWVQPPSPLQREEALRNAQASRVRMMLAAKKEDDNNPESLEIRNEIQDLGREGLITLMLEFGEQDRRQEAVRDVLAKDEWEDITALQDSLREWEEAGYPEGPEWEAVLERDNDYGNQVKERQDELRESAEEGLQLLSTEELEKRAYKKRIEVVGTNYFLRAYEEWMLFYGCRDDEDHNELFFEDPAELKAQPEFVQIALAEKLAEFINDPKQAKN